MKVSATLLSLALAAGAVAQLPGIPQCAQECVNPFLQNGVGDCGTDPTCICGNNEFIVGISCCLFDKCPKADQDTAIKFAAEFCGALGVTTLPTTVACATATGSGSASPTGSATTTGATTTPTTTGTSGTTGTGGAGAAQTSTSPTGNPAPRPTAAPMLGAIGGLVAAVALL
ncbi:hypothetical protein QBC34DRAFT_161955 [Podospora aff. communis PSN243]|uniref:CFEM domain-containing protein n=1 Tax=Podospora aff. communis PSN243 TaxID=3040156 RepID=A0AAV9GDZ2_9PEZI|nr:hypothetical protein QBC34DRAFT_161955 [Podospora aff. communis PSN243]